MMAGGGLHDRDFVPQEGVNGGILPRAQSQPPEPGLRSSSPTPASMSSRRA
jgi:hypothetical protein